MAEAWYDALSQSVKASPAQRHMQRNGKIKNELKIERGSYRQLPGWDQQPNILSQVAFKCTSEGHMQPLTAWSSAKKLYVNVDGTDVTFNVEEGHTVLHVAFSESVTFFVAATKVALTVKCWNAVDDYQSGPPTLSKTFVGDFRAAHAIFDEAGNSVLGIAAVRVEPDKMQIVTCSKEGHAAHLNLVDADAANEVAWEIRGLTMKAAVACNGNTCFMVQDTSASFITRSGVVDKLKDKGAETYEALGKATRPFARSAADTMSFPPTATFKEDLQRTRQTWGKSVADNLREAKVPALVLLSRDASKNISFLAWGDIPVHCAHADNVWTISAGVPLVMNDATFTSANVKENSWGCLQNMVESKGWFEQENSLLQQDNPLTTWSILPKHLGGAYTLESKTQSAKSYFNCPPQIAREPLFMHSRLFRGADSVVDGGVETNVTTELCNSIHAVTTARVSASPFWSRLDKLENYWVLRTENSYVRFAIDDANGHYVIKKKVNFPNPRTDCDVNGIRVHTQEGRTNDIALRISDATTYWTSISGFGNRFCTFGAARVLLFYGDVGESEPHHEKMVVSTLPKSLAEHTSSCLVFEVTPTKTKAYCVTVYSDSNTVSSVSVDGFENVCCVAVDGNILASLTTDSKIEFGRARETEYASIGASSALDELKGKCVAIAMEDVNVYAIAVATHDDDMPSCRITVARVTFQRDRAGIEAVEIVATHDPLYGTSMKTTTHLLKQKFKFKSLALMVTLTDYKVAWVVHSQTSVRVDNARIPRSRTSVPIECPGYVPRDLHAKNQVALQASYQSALPLPKTLDRESMGSAWAKTIETPLDTVVVAQAVYNSCIYFLCYKTHMHPVKRIKFNVHMNKHGTRDFYGNRLMMIDMLKVSTIDNPQRYDLTKITHFSVDADVVKKAKGWGYYSGVFSKGDTITLTNARYTDTIRVLQTYNNGKAEVETPAHYYDRRDTDITLNSKSLKDSCSYFQTNKFTFRFTSDVYGVPVVHDGQHIPTNVPFLSETKSEGRQLEAKQYDEYLTMVRAWIVPPPTGSASSTIVRDTAFCRTFPVYSNGFSVLSENSVITSMVVTQDVQITVLDSDKGTVRNLVLTKTADKTFGLTLDDVAESIVLDPGPDPEGHTRLLDPFIPNVWPLVSRLKGVSSSGYAATCRAAGRQLEYSLNDKVTSNNITIERKSSDGSFSLTFPNHTVLKAAAKMLARICITCIDFEETSEVAVYAQVPEVPTEPLLFFFPEVKNCPVTRPHGNDSGNLIIDWSSTEEAVSGGGDPLLPLLHDCTSKSTLESLMIKSCKISRFVAPQQTQYSEMTVRPTFSSEHSLPGADSDAVHWLEGSIQVNCGIGWKKARQYNKQIEIIGLYEPAYVIPENAVITAENIIESSTGMFQYGTSGGNLRAFDMLNARVVVEGFVYTRWGLQNGAETVKLKGVKNSTQSLFLPPLRCAKMGYDFSSVVASIDPLQTVISSLTAASAKDNAGLKVQMITLKTDGNVHPYKKDQQITSRDYNQVRTLMDFTSNFTAKAFKEFGFSPSMCGVCKTSDVPLEVQALPAFFHVDEEEACVLVKQMLPLIANMSPSGDIEMSVATVQKALRPFVKEEEEEIARQSTVAMFYTHESDVAGKSGESSVRPTNGHTLIFETTNYEAETRKEYFVLSVAIDLEAYSDERMKQYNDVNSCTGKTFSVTVETPPDGEDGRNPYFALRHKDNAEIAHTFKSWNNASALAMGMLQRNNCTGVLLNHATWQRYAASSSFGLAWAIKIGGTTKLMCPKTPAQKATMTLAELWKASSPEERELLCSNDAIVTNKITFQYQLRREKLVPTAYKIKWTYEDDPQTVSIPAEKDADDEDEDEDLVFTNVLGASSRGLSLLVLENTKALPLDSTGAGTSIVHSGITPARGDSETIVEGTLAWTSAETCEHEHANVNSRVFGKWCASKCVGFFYPDTKLVQTGMRAIIPQKPVSDDGDSLGRKVIKLLKALDEAGGDVTYVPALGTGAKPPEYSVVFGDRVVTVDQRKCRAQFFAIAATAHEKFPLIKPVCLVLGGEQVTPTLLNLQGWYTKTQNYDRAIEAILDDVKNVARRSDITKEWCIAAAPVQLGAAATEYALIQCASLDFGLHFKDRQAIKLSTSQKKSSIFAIARKVNSKYPPHNQRERQPRPGAAARTADTLRFTFG